MHFLSLFVHFKRNIRHGSLDKTFLLNYMDKVWLILQFQRTTKQLDMHMTSLLKMRRLFSSYDHLNYARSTAVYLLTLLNIPLSHPGADKRLKQNGFSVNRSDVPSSSNTVDIIIEQTINRQAKTHGGIVGFSQNHSAYYRWCITMHARASYQQTTMEMADMDKYHNQEFISHKELRPSQITRSEEDTCKVVQAICIFINPFESRKQGCSLLFVFRGITTKGH